MGNVLTIALALIPLIFQASLVRAQDSQDPGAAPIGPESYQGFLYGRVTTTEGVAHEGRLRFGEREEAFWGHYFNGFKAQNPWADQVDTELLTRRSDFERFLVLSVGGDLRVELGRPLMARFGDISKLEARSRDLWVTLKSGTVFYLDRYAADDFADGVTVWDRAGEVTVFNEWRVHTIEFLPTPVLSGLPQRLHGTVTTQHGRFAGYVQWDREASLGSDTLNGYTGDRLVRLPFDGIATIKRQSDDSAEISLRDGTRTVLAGTRDTGKGSRGVYVDDHRYGRVLVSWAAFREIRFDSDRGSGPAYGDFPAGQPLAGTITTLDGRHFRGRVVFDLDESETTETLDAPWQGVDYTIPFGHVASIVPADPDSGLARVRVALHGGEALWLERRGDLGEQNPGSLVFVEGREQPHFVPWNDTARIDLEPPLSQPR